MEMISSILSGLLVGGIFIFIFIYLYDVLFGEKREKQLRKIHKYYRNETIKKVDLLEHQPKKFTIYQIKTDKETKKIKLKPGYKIIKIKQKEPAR